MGSRKIEYTEDGVVFEAHAEWDDTREGRLPAVVIAHAWSGQSDEKAARRSRAAMEAFLEECFAG